MCYVCIQFNKYFTLLYAQLYIIELIHHHNIYIIGQTQMNYQFSTPTIKPVPITPASTLSSSQQQIDISPIIQQLKNKKQYGVLYTFNNLQNMIDCLQKYQINYRNLQKQLNRYRYQYQYYYQQNCNKQTEVITNEINRNNIHSHHIYEDKNVGNNNNNNYGNYGNFNRIYDWTFGNNNNQVSTTEYKYIEKDKQLNLQLELKEFIQIILVSETNVNVANQRKQQLKNNIIRKLPVLQHILNTIQQQYNNLIQIKYKLHKFLCYPQLPLNNTVIKTINILIQIMQNKINQLYDNFMKIRPTNYENLTPLQCLQQISYDLADDIVQRTQKLMKKKFVHVLPEKKNLSGLFKQYDKLIDKLQMKEQERENQMRILNGIIQMPEQEDINYIIKKQEQNFHEPYTKNYQRSPMIQSQFYSKHNFNNSTILLQQQPVQHQYQQQHYEDQFQNITNNNNNNWQQKYYQISNQIQVLNQRYMKITNQFEIKDKQLKMYLEKNKELSDRINAFQNSQSSLQQIYDRLNQQFKMLEIENKSKQLQIQRIKRQLQQFQRQLTKLQAEKKQLNLQIKSKSTQMQSYKLKFQQKVDQNTNIRKQINQFMQSILQLFYEQSNQFNSIINNTDISNYKNIEQKLISHIIQALHAKQMVNIYEKFVNKICSILYKKIQKGASQEDKQCKNQSIQDKIQYIQVSIQQLLNKNFKSIYAESIQNKNQNYEKQISKLKLQVQNMIIVQQNHKNIVKNYQLLEKQLKQIKESNKNKLQTIGEAHLLKQQSKDKSVNINIAEYENLNSQNKDLKEKYDQIELEYKRYKIQSEKFSVKLEIELSQLKRDLECKNKIIQKLKITQTNNRIINSDNIAHPQQKQLTKTLQKLKKQKTEIQASINKDKEQQKLYKQSIKKLSSDKNKIQTEYTKKQMDLLKLQDKEKKINQNVKNLQQQAEKYQKEKGQIQQILKNINDLKSNKEKFEAQILLSIEKINQLNNQINLKQNQLQSISLKLLPQQNQLNSVKYTYDNITEQVHQFQQKLLTLQQKQSNLIKNSEILQQKIKQLGKQYQNKQLRYKQQFNNLQKDVKFTNQKLNSLQKIILEKKKENKAVLKSNQPFLVGEIIDDDQDREYIMNQIQKRYKKQIIKTRFLFALPLMKDFNPHINLDEVPNYLIIIKLKNKAKNGKNYLMALYSEPPLQQKSAVSKGFGFMCSITNKKVFQIRKIQTPYIRVAEYNQYYIIFGNNQISLKLNSLQLQSNLGHQFRAYDTQNYKDLEIFAGVKDSQTEMLGYQIYQIMFREE